MGLRDYLRILRKRWLFIATVTALAVAVVAAVTFTTTPLYASSVRLFVSTSTSGDVSEAYQGGLFTQARVASYADLLEGERLAAAVVADLGMDRDAASVQQATSAHVVPETVLLTATVTDPSPQLAQRMATSLGRQFTELVTELETPPGGDRSTVKVAVVDDADVPISPVSPQSARNLTLAAVLGLLLAIGAAVLRDVLDTSVRTTENVADRGLPPLGTTIFDDKSQDGPVLLQGDSMTPQAEAFRQLRTSLQFADVDDPPRTVVVTSSLPVEGKTSTAVNLALAMAMAGVRTVLVDAELRRPRIAHYMNLIGEVGLTTVLVGQADLDDVLQPYGGTGLTVLPSGPTPPNPSELLGTRHMASLLETLRQRFEMVILDSPPLLPVTDAAVLARSVDGVIVVVRYGRTSHDQLATTTERLRAVDAKLLGGILTMVPVKDSTAGGYGYGYEPEPTRPTGHHARPSFGARSRYLQGSS